MRSQKSRRNTNAAGISGPKSPFFINSLFSRSNSFQLLTFFIEVNVTGITGLGGWASIPLRRVWLSEDMISQ
jgi:hypothetical protein